MSKCYQCGLPEGSEERLCETCYRNRFHRGLLVVDTVSQDEVKGIDCSPQMQRLVLSSGAFICIGLVGLAVMFQGHGPNLTQQELKREYVRYEAGYFPLDHQQTVGFIRGPLGTRFED